jgi:hypothetical protein
MQHYPSTVTHGIKVLKGEVQDGHAQAREMGLLSLMMQQL